METRDGKLYHTWEDFDKDINSFISFLNEKGLDKDNSVILGIKRGGLPSAAALSNKTGIPISLVSFQTRDGSDSVPNFLESELFGNKNILIVDDIFDSGLTAIAIKNTIKVNYGIDENKIFGMFHFQASESASALGDNFYFAECSNHAWVVFPWE